MDPYVKWTKKQLVAALMAATSVGAGGTQVVGAVFGVSGVDAAPAIVFTHAVDLRREYAAGPDAGIAFTVYGNMRTDAGIRDVNQSKSCSPGAKTTADARALMNALAKECVWP